ncbi:hypothetical protein DMJ13_21205 [halophilic archaeon]|nr:hypothetical protein DMJ13_21205 [halophilic archaeon]
MGSEETCLARRTILAGTASGVMSGLAGCQIIRGKSQGSTPVSILSAGSLQLALGEGLTSESNIPLKIESHGSVTVARMVAEGQRDPDIVTLADPALFNSILQTPWYAGYANNALVVVYNSDTQTGQKIASADHWYEPLLDRTATLGRTDPALDPLGYRTLFMFRLASKFYGRPKLANKILGTQQLYPETELLSHFETGSLDAAVVYRNMAVEREYEFIDLPDQIDLSNPKYANDWYSTVSHRLTRDRRVTGDVISYAATIRDGHHNTRTHTVFETLVQGQYLNEFGFRTPPSYPTYTDHAPDTLTE